MGNRKNFVVPGGLTIDSSTLYVDDPNNRVGIGKTDPDHELDVTGVIRASNGVVTLTSAGTPVASLPDGAIAIDTTNAKLFFRSGSTWNEVTGGGGGGGGGSLTVATTAPVSPSEGDLWYESDSGITFVYYDSYWVEIGPSVIDELSSTATAKGDILVATSSGNLSRIGVGTDDFALVADSTQATGLNWKKQAVYSIMEAKGDIIVGQSDDVALRLAAGANDAVLVADSGESVGLKWTKTPSGLTLSQAKMQATQETLYIANTAATGTINVDCANYSTFYYTANATANWTFNFRGSSSLPLNTLMAIGDQLTVAFLVTNGGTAYRPTAFQTDGNSITPKYQAGIGFSSGSTNAIDAYVFTLIKTANTVFTLLASQTKYS